MKPVAPVTRTFLLTVSFEMLPDYPERQLPTHVVATISARIRL